MTSKPFKTLVMLCYRQTDRHAHNKTDTQAGR